MTSDQADQFWLLAGEVPTGPFTVAQIHAELAAGRATWQTSACPVGSNGWQPLVRTPGFGPDNEASEPLAVPPQGNFGVSEEDPASDYDSVDDEHYVSSQGAYEKCSGNEINIGRTVVVCVIFLGIADGLLEWFRPYTPKEVCTHFIDAETATVAKRYITKRMHPYIDSIYAVKSEANPDDTFELTDETTGELGNKLVGFRGSFYDSEAGRSVNMEGHFQLVDLSGWKVDVWVMEYIDGELPKPVSLVDNYHANAGQPGGPKLPPGVRAPGPAKPLQLASFQRSSICDLLTSAYGIAGIAFLAIVLGISVAQSSNQKS